MQLSSSALWLGQSLARLPGARSSRLRLIVGVSAVFVMDQFGGLAPPVRHLVYPLPGEETDHVNIVFAMNTALVNCVGAAITGRESRAYQEFFEAVDGPFLSRYEAQALDQFDVLRSNAAKYQFVLERALELLDLPTRRLLDSVGRGAVVLQEEDDRCSLVSVILVTFTANVSAYPDLYFGLRSHMHIKDALLVSALRSDPRRIGPGDVSIVNQHGVPWDFAGSPVFHH